MNHFAFDLSSCAICPRNCLVNRKTKLGYCQKGEKLEVSWYGAHFGEEPSISGVRGSGTIFFTGCNLSCVYCQNWQISQNRIRGKLLDNPKLGEILLKLQSQGVHNINLVTPTIWTVQLIKVIKWAKKRGLKIPIVWNSNAYEKVETLKQLEGLVDIYLPDFKYADDDLGVKFSLVKNYSTIAKKAIYEMQRQVGDLKVGKNGMAVKGLIVRHLILPSHLENTRKCLTFIRSLSKNIHLSLMSQYSPVFKAGKFKEINRELTKEEDKMAKKIMEGLNFKYGWIQEFGESVKNLQPDFRKSNPFEK